MLFYNAIRFVVAIKRNVNAEHEHWSMLCFVFSVILDLCAVVSSVIFHVNFKFSELLDLFSVSVK